MFDESDTCTKLATEKYWKKWTQITLKKKGKSIFFKFPVGVPIQQATEIIIHWRKTVNMNDGDSPDKPQRHSLTKTGAIWNWI